MERKTALEMLILLGDEFEVLDEGRKEHGYPALVVRVRKENGHFVIPGADGKEHKIDPDTTYRFYQAKQSRDSLLRDAT